IRLIEKSGGKTDFVFNSEKRLRCAVIVCSDSVSGGKTQDTAGKAIIGTLEKHRLECAGYEVIPDDFNTIQSTLKHFTEAAFDLVIFTGGTGLSQRDLTPDAVGPLIETHIPGIMEAARSYGQLRTAHAMLSRGVAGFIKNTLVLTLPGSK